MECVIKHTNGNIEVAIKAMKGEHDLYYARSSRATNVAGFGEVWCGLSLLKEIASWPFEETYDLLKMALKRVRKAYPRVRLDEETAACWVRSGGNYSVIVQGDDGHVYEYRRGARCGLPRLLPTTEGDEWEYISTREWGWGPDDCAPYGEHIVVHDMLP